MCWAVLDIYQDKQKKTLKIYLLFLTSLLTAMYTRTQFCSNKLNCIGLGYNHKKYHIFLMKAAKVFSWQTSSALDTHFKTPLSRACALYHPNELWKAHSSVADNLQY